MAASRKSFREEGTHEVVDMENLVNTDRQRRDAVPEEVQKKIIQAIRDIRYGSINITVQDGHVIQIDKLEKEKIK